MLLFRLISSNDLQCRHLLMHQSSLLVLFFFLDNFKTRIPSFDAKHSFSFTLP